MIVSAFIAYAPPAQAFMFPGDIFGGYVRGREAAAADNRRDQAMYYYNLQAAINNDIQAFNISGDWGYLCHAYYLGSGEAERFLFDNDMRCRFTEQ
jgi:hypothetical protein